MAIGRRAGNGDDEHTSDGSKAQSADDQADEGLDELEGPFDIDDFDEELDSAGMLERTLPWFYKIDATLHPVDAISAGEWDDNIPQNMAPVLKSFLAGTLRARRDPLGKGATLL